MSPLFQWLTAIHNMELAGIDDEIAYNAAEAARIDKLAMDNKDAGRSFVLFAEADEYWDKVKNLKLKRQNVINAHNERINLLNQELGMRKAALALIRNMIEERKKQWEACMKTPDKKIPVPDFPPSGFNPPLPPIWRPQQTQE